MSGLHKHEVQTPRTTEVPLAGWNHWRPVDARVSPRGAGISAHADVWAYEDSSDFEGCWE